MNFVPAQFALKVGVRRLDLANRLEDWLKKLTASEFGYLQETR
jgi:hypothetical protein